MDTENNCRNEKSMCNKCSQEHLTNCCKSPTIKCYHCKEDHYSGDKNCPVQIYEKEILTIQTKYRTSRQGAINHLKKQNTNTQRNVNYATITANNNERLTETENRRKRRAVSSDENEDPSTTNKRQRSQPNQISTYSTAKRTYSDNQTKEVIRPESESNMETDNFPSPVETEPSTSHETIDCIRQFLQQPDSEIDPNIEIIPTQPDSFDLFHGPDKTHLSERTRNKPTQDKNKEIQKSYSLTNTPPTNSKTTDYSNERDAYVCANTPDHYTSENNLEIRKQTEKIFEEQFQPIEMRRQSKSPINKQSTSNFRPYKKDNSKIPN